MQRCEVLTLHQGPTWKFKFLVKNQKCDTDVIQETLQLNNLDLSIRFSRTIAYFQGTIFLKKFDHHNNLMVTLNVICNRNEEQFICPNVGNKWVAEKVDITFNSGYYKKYLYMESNCSYNFYLNVNIQDMPTLPVASIVTSQLYQDEDFTDFQLQGSDGTVRVHKTVLLAHSELIKKALLRCPTEKEASLKMNGFSMKTLQCLKAYMYLGMLPEEGLKPLLLVASYYSMDKLKADCITKMVGIVKPHEIDGLVKFACNNNLPDLVKAMLYHLLDL